MKKEINSIVKSIKKQMSKNTKFKVFIASKNGGNATGKGINRSVLLATHDGKEYYQYYKIWGFNNEHIAKEIIKQISCSK